MKKTLRDYLPILMMLLCAAGFGALLLTGVIDLNTVPQLVEHRPVLAVLVILALFIAKGFSGVVVYNALVVVVSLILPLPAAFAISGVWNAPDTASGSARRAPAALQFSIASARAAFSPAITS